MNNKGITLMELLAYLALVGIVVTLLTGTMSYAVKSFDKVNGEGAVYTEANFIMSNLMVQANTFSPEYIRSCDDNEDTENKLQCVELVIENEKVIDPVLGILKEVKLDSKKIVTIKTENSNIYINNMKLNSKDFSTTDTKISYTCYDGGSVCQKFVLSIKLVIKRVGSTGEPYIFENKFSF